MHPKSNQKNAKTTKQIMGLLSKIHKEIYVNKSNALPKNRQETWTPPRCPLSTHTGKNYPGRETSKHYTEKLLHNLTVRLTTAKTKPKTIVGKDAEKLEPCACCRDSKAMQAQETQ